MSAAYYGRAVPLALRRFARLPCVPYAGPDAPALRPLVLPGDLPLGLHVVLLLRRQRDIEHADSWLGVREAWERVLDEKGVRKQGEMQMYICCLLPRLWPLRWVWRWRMRHWFALLKGEDGDAHPAAHLLWSNSWADGFFDSLQLHDDGRAYAMVIRNDGEIVWASHDKFKEHVQENAMMRTVNEECTWRIDEQERLLEKQRAEALPEPAHGVPAEDPPEKAGPAEAAASGGPEAARAGGA